MRYRTRQSVLNAIAFRDSDIVAALQLGAANSIVRLDAKTCVVASIDRAAKVNGLVVAKGGAYAQRAAKMRAAFVVTACSEATAGGGEERRAKVIQVGCAREGQERFHDRCARARRRLQSQDYVV